MFKRGSKLSADGLNRLISDSHNSIVSNGRIIRASRPGLNTYMKLKGEKGGGTGFTIKYVPKLPKISGEWKTPKFVFWCTQATWDARNPGNNDTANGDDQVWAWYPHASYFVPLQKYSYLSGVPEYVN